METDKILTASLLDIIFEGRNKSYGAYELRMNYEGRMLKALAITTALGIAIAGGVWLKNTFAPPVVDGKLKIIPDVTISEVKEEKKELPPPPQPPAAKVEVPKIKTIAFTTPVLTETDIVKPPPAQTDLTDMRISNITQDGIKDNGVIIPPEDIDGKRGLIVTAKKEAEQPFIKVEVDASYPGNWRSFLERNLDGQVATDNGAPSGTYTVIIQFIVDVNGSVSDIKPLTNVGFGMEQEAVRVIKKSGKWKPAIQNGREVKAYRRQPITFQILEQ